MENICKGKRKGKVKTAAIYLLLLSVFIAVFLNGCSNGNGSVQISSYEDLNKSGIIIGVSTNTPEATKVLNDFPDATIEGYSEWFSNLLNSSGI